MTQIPTTTAGAAKATQAVLADTDDPVQAASLAWRWASHVHPGDTPAAKRAYFAVLAAANIEPPDPNADPEPAAKPAPDPDPETGAPDPDDDPEPEDEQAPRAPTATPDHEPLPGNLLARLEALTRRVETTEPHVAAPVPKWDPDETPTIAGEVALAEYADLRQRGGAVRILTLRTTSGPTEIWASWQQAAALLRAAELAHGRTLQPGDLLAIRAAGKQRIGKSRSPSRLFTLSIEWAS